MRAHAPPINGEAALGDAATPKLTGLSQSNSSFALRQACQHITTRIERRPSVHALEILAEIMRLRAMQEPIGRIFWYLEQRISRLTDEIERRGS
jgi:hypothetical protein